MTEHDIIPPIAKTRIPGIQLDLLADCEPHTNEEEVRNRGIERRMKSILEERIDGPLSSISFVFISTELFKTGIGVDYHLNKTESTENVPVNFNFPTFRIATNSVNRIFVNSTDGLVYREDIMFYFNKEGQTLRHILINREPVKSVYQKRQIKRRLMKVGSLASGKVSIFERVTQDECAYVMQWLELIEGGKCIERYLPAKQEISSTSK